MGSGRFLAPKTLEVKLNDGGTRVLVADKVFLNVGTHAAIPNVPGLQATQPLTHVEALELDYLPQHLIVIGGGYSGLELAQAYRRFGSDVTVIESGPQLMAREDIDVSQEMRRILSDEAIQVLVEAELLEVVGRSGDKVTLTARTPSGEQRIDGSDILVAAGAFRTPPKLDLRTPALNWTGAVTFASMADWRRVRRTCGRWGNAPAAHNSPIYQKTIFESSGTISQVEIAARTSAWFHIACSLILHSPTSG
jgi:pyruvate/2-oxoglutarate dehydrogenase complex dihydrolipoamide dehydrogenase (E3) component